jgi:hypothetical protein
MTRFVITYRDQGREEFPDLVVKSFDSVKKLGYDTVLIGTGVTGAATDHLIPSGKAEEALLANWILYARQLYIESPLFDCDSVFIDPDVLVVRPIDDVFDMDFDIAFTERDVKGDEINTGVVFVKPHKKDQLIGFFNELRKKSRNYPYNKQTWFGDQKAVNDVLRETGDKYGDLKIIRIPCDIWNASPCIEKTPEKLERNRKMAAEARIMHFKGYRKSLMDVWEATA